MKKVKPQITHITQIFLFFLRVFSFNFVANVSVIFIAVPHDAAPSPGKERKPTPMVCAACRLPSPRG
jgi:hypothetical protein